MALLLNFNGSLAPSFLCAGASTKLLKLKGIKTPRRLLLGLGASFMQHLSFMASASASARQKGVVEQVLKNVEWPEKFPFTEEDFRRFDETPDSLFYDAPRFVTHIDDPAIAALTKFYSKFFPPSNTPGVCLLDLCSSWVSHYPAGYKQDRIVGMGMNEEELMRNPVLTEYVVQDLNVNPSLPFQDNSFDVITNVVSVDYLTKPIDVFKEMGRILKPGGLAIMSFSNRCFFTKAISIWTSTGDADHVWIVGSYFHYAGGFEPPQAVDISPNPGRSDPIDGKVGCGLMVAREEEEEIGREERKMRRGNEDRVAGIDTVVDENVTDCSRKGKARVITVTSRMSKWTATIALMIVAGD